MDNYPSSSSRIIELLGSSSPREEEQIQPNFRVISEREHMFDKVVTPSDVGKLNRLVIPKQHAEKYFPLDSPSHGEENKIKGGLLLNFEDYATGKSWRFRYSYWNSSQSYVMTKGWSRFVKEKKLNPGDIVSFLRSSSISSSSSSNSNNNYTFFIDWRRRRRPDNYNSSFSNPPPPFDLLRSHHPHLLPPPPHGDQRYPRFYPSLYMDNFAPNLLNARRSMLFPYAPHLHGNIITRSTANYAAPPPPSYADYHPAVVQQEGHMEEGRAEGSVVLEPVPVVQGKGGGTVGKRLRLFGVNMDCSNNV